MAEGQKKRQVGKGMKPRGNKRFKPQKETRAMVEKVTNEGQVQGAPEPVLEPKVRNETPGNLEPENGTELLQNLEQKEAIVAHDGEYKETLEVPTNIPAAREFQVHPESSDLEAALNESGVIDGEFAEVEEETYIGHGQFVKDGVIYNSNGVSVGMVIDTKSTTGKVIDLETAMAVGTGTVKELEPPCGGVPMGKRPTIAELEELLNRHGSEGVSLETNGAVKLAIGPQPDGSEKFIITIQEGYTDAVRQWAEADGVTVEQWLSDRLYEYVSTYGEPAKGR